MKNRNRLFVPTLIIAAIGLAGLVFVSARSASREATRNKPSDAASATLPTQRLYVHPGRLWPQLRWNLKALGDRLERPGKEKMIISGTLTRAGSAAPTPVVLNIEAPSRITLTIQSGLQPEVVYFDGTESAVANLATSQRDLVETLLFDSAESFFFGQMKSSATRGLGSRFRLDEGSSGPFYDIYAVIPRVRLTPVTGAKLFHFDSETLLLNLVHYQLECYGRSVRVEVRLSDWRDLSGQKMAHRVERIEDGANVMTLMIDSVVFASGTPGVTP